MRLFIEPWYRVTAGLRARVTASPAWSFALSALLGAASVLGYAPFHIFIVPVLALSGLFLVVLLQPTATRATLVAFCFGLGLFVTGVGWIHVSLHSYGGVSLGLAMALTIAFCAFLALFVALFGALAWFGRSDHSFFSLLSLSSLWVASEWLRGVVLTGFPWLAVGYSQVPDSPLFGFAPVIGVYGVSALVAATAAALSQVLVGPRRTAFYVTALVSPIWVTGGLLGHASWTDRVDAPFMVSLLQGNVAQDKKWRKDEVDATLESYLSLLRMSEGRLIVMPETALPVAYNDLPPRYAATIATILTDKRADLIMGMIERTSNDGKVKFYNSAFSLGISPEQIYRKRHLVPFGEYNPGEPLFGKLLNVLQIPLADLSPGPAKAQPLGLQGTQIAVNICFEDLFGEEIISALPQATLLVNMSNLAWFRDTIALPQHLQIGQMRAAEAGRYMLTASNTGITAIINERGRVLQQASTHQALVLSGKAQRFSGATPYVRFGNLPVLLFAAAGLLLSLRRIGTARSLSRAEAFLIPASFHLQSEQHDRDIQP